MVRAWLAAITILALVPCRQAWAEPGPDEVERPPQDPGILSESTSDPDPALGTDPASCPESGQSNETVVRAPRPVLSDPTRDAPAVSGERLRRGVQPSLLENVSREMPGVHVTSRGIGPHGAASGASGGITIRGLGGSPNTQILVVEDGVPDAQGIFGHPIPDAYVSSLMDDVTVVKGGDSVLYGTNAMGGAILMRSRWRDDDGWELGSDTSYGSFDTFGETLFVLGRAGPWDGAAAFRASRTDGHRDGAGGRILAFHAGGRHRFDNNWTLSLRSRTVNVAGADPGPVTHPTPDHYFDVWRESASLRLQWKHDRATVAITPYANLGWHRLYDGFASLDWTVGGTAEGVVMLHDTVELLVGLGAEAVDGRVQDRIAGTRSDMDGRVDLSFYNQLTWRPLEGLSLVLGSRELYSLEHGFVFLFKGGARWRFLDGAFVRTSISRNFRQPTLRERYLPFPAANPDLRPETSLNWDFGAGYDSRYVSVQVTGYRTQADDLIRYFGAWPSAEVVNIGSLVIWGVEGRLDLRSLGPVSAHVSGGWQDVGRFTRQNPSARVDFGIDVARDFGRHRAAGSLSGGWVHGLYMNNYGRDRIDDPVFLDLALRYRYRVRSANVGVEPYLLLRNLLDRRFAWIQSYPMPGFNVLAGLSIEVGR